MKKRCPLFILLALVVILMLLPISSLSADTSLVINGDFSQGSAGWNYSNFPGGYVGFHHGIAEMISTNAEGTLVYLWQDISTSSKNLILSFDVKRTASGIESSTIAANFALYKDGPLLGWAGSSVNYTVDGNWHRNNKLDLAKLWKDQKGSSMPDFDELQVYFTIDYEGEAYIDNVKLYSKSITSEEPVWVRNMPMTCWQVFINEDNNFQFIFWYPYKDKNWVRIYDMEGNMVYEVDVPVDNPNIIVDLPDGFYNVKTFHDQELLQEFLIGKP